MSANMIRLRRQRVQVRPFRAANGRIQGWAITYRNHEYQARRNHAHALRWAHAHAAEITRYGYKVTR